MAIDAVLEYPSLLKELFDPPAEFLALAGEAPMCRLRYADGRLGWILFDYDRARTVLNDPRFSVHPGGAAGDDGGFIATVEQFANPGDLLRLDPPAHTRIRKGLTAFFTVQAIARLRPEVERIVDELLDEIEAAGPPIDFVREFSLRVPSMTICSLLGVPASDGPRFEQPTQVIMSGTRTTQAEKQAAVEGFYDYVRSVIARKRKDPGDDLITKLLARGELTDDELAGVTWFLFSAGHDTTNQSFAYMTYYLLYEPDRWQAVCASAAPEQIVEELLRYLPIFRFSIGARTALEDVDLDGYIVKAGEPVTVYLNVLNRDPARFDHPDECDHKRDPKGHMQFGFGRHMCLGQHLARLELRVELARVVERFPTLRLAVPPDEVRLIRDGFAHGYIVELPVTW